MAQTFTYFHPLTPESPRTVIDLGTQAVRLGDVPGWATAAEMGDVAQTNIVIDDPTGTAGNAGDAILGLWTFYVDEDDCPATGSGDDGTGGQRLFTGYITDRTYRRGNTAPSTSLVQGPARRIDISLTDVNALATFRIIAGTGSGADDGNRPAETDVERVQWLISTVWLPVTDDAGWIDTGSPVDMDACDYRGQTPADVLSDCSLASGKNWWIQYFEPTNTDVLWYQDSNTSTEYTSDIALSDDLADVDFIETFPYMPDAELRRSPERVYAGVYLPYANGAVYEEQPSTAGYFAWRDGSAPTSNVSTETTAEAVAIRLLNDADAEDDRVTCRAQLPSSLATAIKAGQRLLFRSTFMPGYDEWRWMRVQRCSVAQDEETQERYTFTLELSPQPAALLCPTSLSSRVTATIAVGSVALNGQPSTSITPTAGQPCLLFGCFGLYNADTASPGTGMTQAIAEPGISHTFAYAEYRAIASPSGSYTVGATLTAISDTPAYSAVAVAIRTAATAPVQVASGATVDGTPVSITLPSPPTPGNMLVWVMGKNIATPDITPGDTYPAQGTGWTQILNQAGTASGHNVWGVVYAHCVETGDPQTYSGPYSHDKAAILFEVAIT